MTKEELRKLYLEKRRQLTIEERTYLSRRICDRFFTNVYADKFVNIHIFLPIHKFNEVDTWLFVEQLKSRKLPAKMIISKIDLSLGTMTNYYYNPEKQLIENKWGVPEQESGEICDNLSIDLILVPLLAFDNQGHRVGYGKGFYDRFLKSCREDAFKVGLSYYEAEDLIMDAGENDVVLDCVITPENLYWFKN